jgi:hypothetical protein
MALIDHCKRNNVDNFIGLIYQIMTININNIFPILEKFPS